MAWLTCATGVTPWIRLGTKDGSARSSRASTEGRKDDARAARRRAPRGAPKRLSVMRVPSGKEWAPISLPHGTGDRPLTARVQPDDACSHMLASYVPGPEQPSHVRRR